MSPPPIAPALVHVVCVVYSFKPRAVEYSEPLCTCLESKEQCLFRIAFLYNSTNIPRSTQSMTSRYRLYPFVILFLAAGTRNGHRMYTLGATRLVCLQHNVWSRRTPPSSAAGLRHPLWWTAYDRSQTSTRPGRIRARSEQSLTLSLCGEFERHIFGRQATRVKFPPTPPQGVWPNMYRRVLR